MKPKQSQSGGITAFALFITFLLTALCSISQDTGHGMQTATPTTSTTTSTTTEPPALRPTVQAIDNDTFFCWTVPQARIIALDLEAGVYADTLLEAQERSIRYLREGITARDSIIGWQRQQITGLQEANNGYIQSIETCRNDLEEESQKARKEKRKRVALGILSILAIIGNSILVATQ